jgi:ferredoxin-NADP reductase
MTLEATITSIQHLTPDVKQFVLEADDHVFEYEPGQHTRIRYETDTERKGMGRPYTATTLPDTSHITLVIKHVEDGAASTYMHERNEGETILIDELGGQLVLEDLHTDVVFVSTGVGITPMLAMLRQYLEEGTGQVHFFFGEQDQEHLIHHELLDQLEDEHENLSVVYSLTDAADEWNEPTGYIQNHLEEYLPGFDEKHFYVCGVPTMVVDTKEKLLAHGVSAERIFTEGWEEGVVQAQSEPLSIYDTLGGMEAVESVVDRMYDHILADERLAPYFDEANVDSLIEHQTKFIAMVAGGPEYHQHIAETHAHMGLRDEHFDAVLAYFHRSLAEHDIDEEHIHQLKSQLQEYRANTVTA